MIDTIKASATYLYAFAVLAIASYGLIFYPFELPDLVQGALIAWVGQALQFVFGSETAKAASAASQRAYDKGLNTPTPPAPSNAEVRPVPEDIP